MYRNRKTVALLAVLLLIGATACQKESEVKHEEPAAHSSNAPADTHAAGDMAAGHGEMGAKHEKAAPKEVVVTDDIRAAWKAQTITVKYKDTGESKNYEVNPESEFIVPDTGLTLKVGAYLPDFSMTPDQIISRSAEEKNPALQVTILDGGVEKYQGWLFAKFPDMHAFEHPKYSISLAAKSGSAESAPGGSHAAH